MKRRKGFKKGYLIKITNGFYEVISGNRVVYFGECDANSSVEEVAGKTIYSR